MSPDKHHPPKKPREKPAGRADAARDNSYEVAYFKRRSIDDAGNAMPGRTFIRSSPESVRRKIYATLEAVAKAPPHSFAGGGRWEAMHGAMTGWFEVRCDGGDPRMHYRVFCLLDHNVPGEDRPLLVVVTGLVKSLGSTFSDSDYAKVRALGEEYRRGPDRSLG